MKIYKEAISEAWQDRKRIVYGSEEIDFATSDLDSVDPEKVMDGVFEILPWNQESRLLQKKDLEVVILHKGSRLEHLLELWQDVELDGGSFRKFLSDRTEILSTTDGLGLAKKFLERDVRISIIDTSGVESLKHTNICHILSCDILGVRCSEDVVDAVKRGGDDISRRFIGFHPSPPGDLDLKREEMDAIERIMSEYDCGLRGVLEKYSQQTRLLYQKDLFSKCNPSGSAERPFSWVISEIIKIVDPLGRDMHTPRAPGEVAEALSTPSVVIFPGPHGVSSSNLQRCFSKWGSRENPLIGNWTWAAPNPNDLPLVNLRKFGAHKAFAPYFAMLSGQKSFYNDTTIDIDHQKVIDLYRTSILEAWRGGRRLLIGSEEMDWAVSMIETMDTSKILEGVFDILPMGNHEGSRKLQIDEIVAVIPYDADRVEHLRSIWYGTSKASGLSFRSFLLQKGNMFSTSNTLGLVKAYLDRGIRTVVADMSGIKALNNGGANGCHVVACEVMGESFDSEKLRLNDSIEVSSLDARITDGFRVDFDDRPMPVEEMVKIKAIILEYECGLRDVLLDYERAGKLKVLHQRKLFLGCPESPPRRRFSWMIREIQRIAAGVTQSSYV
ncbi:hypothetical protein IV203_008717 [Nitzschia inconspicua]|uniref:Uncharacterized protein n=1 Tax=Nitzschia inconspicua TaxID=303405 RepID=A0A9K3KZ37_9STRA|nr:hypothetical protein IV203_008717 [Nitzschia inconspicua]